MSPHWQVLTSRNVWKCAFHLTKHEILLRAVTKSDGSPTSEKQAMMQEPICGCPALLIQKIREIVCRVPREWVNSMFLWKDADVLSLADKCIVVGCFVCGDYNYDKILMETGKFSDNIRVTDNGLVWCWQIAFVVEFQVLEGRRSTWSTP